MISLASKTMTTTAKAKVVGAVAGVAVMMPMTAPTMTIVAEVVVAVAMMARKTIVADVTAMMSAAATGIAMTIAGVTGTVTTAGGIATVSVDVIVTKRPSA